MFKKSVYFCCLLASWVIVAFGQPSRSSSLSLCASACGFALFWFAALKTQGKKRRFVVSTLWFFAVQSVQLSWMATPEYQGGYIFFVYAGLALWFGLQFGFLSLLFPDRFPMTITRILLICSTWTLIEWGRLFILCGFPWNPVGLSMTAYAPSSQMVALFGVFGLSFWVVLVNLLALNLFFFVSKKQIFNFGVCFLLPYLFGCGHIYFHDSFKKNTSPMINALLIQPGLLPDQKSFFYDKRERFIDPLVQWREMIHSIEEKAHETIDLIVFPESAAPFSASSCVYPYEWVSLLLQKEWKVEDRALRSLLLKPFAEKNEGSWHVNNAFWCQAIASHYGAEVIMGLDDTDKQTGRSYSSAFHFQPKNFKLSRYDKRVLVPLAEYLPLKFLKPLVERYGIGDFFDHGKEAKVFGEKSLLSCSICYEECYGNMMREGRKKGAEVFVNITNDAWFPSSQLPLQHFYHGRLRALENGVPLLRSCNTGVTAGIDSLGRTVGILQGKKGVIQERKGVLFLTLNASSYRTLYTIWGDGAIIAISFSLIGFFFALNIFKIKIFNKKH